VHNKIVKAEILWSRTCGLKCPYCAMVTNEQVTKDLFLWERGVEQLKQLDCGFCAIYGAEPLDDFDGLPQFVRMLWNNDILCTLITNCCSRDVQEKLSILYANGLRSLTVSYDGEGDEIVDTSSRAKTNRGIQYLRWFRDSFVDVRDVAAVSTINRKNFLSIPKIVEKMTNENIWMLFDFIHPDNGQPGTKCRNTELTKELLFTEEDLPKLIEVLKELVKLKQSGHLVHWSEQLVNFIIENPNVLLKYNWHCAKDKAFPSWITVEHTGEVYCCDDFHVTDEDRKRIYLWK
jgi:MoaA/NifB/PqqE/SkfB family radical SAM enzyme